MSNHLHDLMTSSRFNADTVVLRFANGTGWTRQQLFDRVGRYASVLQSLGLQAGDRLCLQVEKSVETAAGQAPAPRPGPPGWRRKYPRRSAASAPATETPGSTRSTPPTQPPKSAKSIEMLNPSFFSEIRPNARPPLLPQKKPV